MLIENNISFLMLKPGWFQKISFYPTFIALIFLHQISQYLFELLTTFRTFPKSFYLSYKLYKL